MTLQRDIEKAMQALQSGQFKAAYKQARALLGKQPGSAFLMNLAGLAQAQQGRHRDALPYFLKAAKADARFDDARRNAAQSLIVLAEPDKAETVLRGLLRTAPRDAVAHYLLAQALMAQSRPAEALIEAEAAAEANPRLGSAQNLRGLALKRLDRVEEAIEAFRAAIALNPRDPEARVNIGQSLALVGRSDEAVGLLEDGLKHAPDHIGLQLGRAGMLDAVGRTADAIAANRKVLVADPANPYAINNLAHLLAGDDGRALVPAVERAMAAATRGSEMEVTLAFARSALLRRLADPGAEDALRAANALAARLAPYDPAEEERLQERLFAPFAQGALPQATEVATPAPIFVLGLIRSGTTLTEQVLSAHPHVFGAGELAKAGRLAQALEPGQATAQAFDAFARDYRAALPPMPADCAAFVDKMPGNFRIVGHLLAAFPNARIVHLLRDPRDIALSIWQVYFPAGHPYAYDMARMAHHMNLYARTMARWHTLFPGRIHDLGYADLVADIDGQSRRLAEIAGLDWVPAMARPQNNDRAVLTASSGQVREAVHTRSVGKWRRHEALLAPLVDALNPALWPGLGSA